MVTSTRSGRCSLRRPVVEASRLAAIALPSPCLVCAGGGGTGTIVDMEKTGTPVMRFVPAVWAALLHLVLFAGALAWLWLVQRAGLRPNPKAR